MQNIPSLTPLRGIAALLVLLFHLVRPGYLYGLTGGREALVISKGYLWVDFFFVLSGFIIAHVYRGDFLDGVSRAHYGRFLLARLARIFPLHVFMLGLFVALELTRLVVQLLGLGSDYPVFFGARSIESLIASMLFLHFAHMDQSSAWNSVAWSLSVEWWCYVVFPFVAAVTWHRVTSMRAVAGLLCLFLTAFWLGTVDSQRQLDLLNYWAMARGGIEFLIGMLIYWFYERRRWAGIVGSDVVFWGAFLLVFLLFHLGAPDASVIPIFGVIALSAAYNRGIAYKILNTRPMVFLGEISFSLYLTHMFLLGTLWKLQEVLFGPSLAAGLGYGGSAIALLLFIAITIGFSYMTWRFVEVPGRAFIRSFVRKSAVVPALS